MLTAEDRAAELYSEDLPATNASGTADAKAAKESGKIEEIVVTAEKRESTVQKTPISMSAYSGEVLAAQGTTNMLAVAEETPGVSFRTSGAGQTEFEVRGLSSSGGATATVGYYFDDVPISPPALGDIGKVVIDPNLYDVSRVEVLRGPQGTLYGAGSMGGTIKVVTNAAKVDTFEAAADGSVSGTDGGGINRGANALMNFPLLAGKIAARVVVSSSFTDGWIDRIIEEPFPFPTNATCSPTAFFGCARGNVLSSQNQRVVARTNTTRLDAIRANVVFDPMQDLHLSATVMYQHTSSGGYSEFDSPPGASGPLAHYQPFDTPEPTEDYVRLASISSTYKFSGAQFTSSTSYWTRDLHQFQDGSELNQNIYGLPAFFPGQGTTEIDNIRQFAEELRLSSQTPSDFQWLVGAFYSDLKYQWYQSDIAPAATNLVYASGLYAPVTAADNPQGILYEGQIPYSLRQYAGFVDLSYQLSPALKLSLGGRYYDYRTVVNATQSGIFTQSVSAVPTVVNSSIGASGANPKLNLDYAPSDDLTVYGTVAKGFRPGGINLPLPAAGPNSCTGALQAIGQTSGTNGYDGDSVWSYEIGEKARLADDRIVINSAIYYIRWNDIQQLVPLSCGYFITVNAGNARSFGSEVEAQLKLTQNWSVSATGGYTNATINDPDPRLDITPGTPILNIPKYTGSGAVMYLRPLSNDINLTGRLAATYFGSVTDEAFTYVRLPSYTLVNARIGLESAHWSAHISGSNLTNKIAELTANNTSLSSNSPAITRISTNQPRTIGLELSTKF